MMTTIRGDRVSKWIRIAHKVSLTGQHIHHKMAALIVKGGAILSQASNIADTHGQPNRGKHAERRALRPHLNLKDATMYIIRNNMRCSKPCARCMNYIVDSGISEIVYINWDGNVTKEKIYHDRQRVV